jgi:peptidylprolyl isomerase
MRRLAPFLAAAVLSAGIAGCGDDSEDKAGEPASKRNDSTAADPTPRPTVTATPGAAATAALKDLSKKPVITKPSGDPPTGLQIDDIVKGKGKAARSGDSVSVQYVGASFSTGEEFDASWDRGEPFAFELGGGQVIQGWDSGIVGMKVGGRRQLTIPPEQGYGAQGSPPAIAPNETLVFVVDLKKIG